ncbi:vesicle transport through interaction with t-SNAREs homolog 1B [Drosophila serrata]|uniref:vesicle transport through interaction with t-SNAREs homolog 1B n=1 Tax=Drosophila serrata TaxID=7274 RepID=UPI000A1CF637|nr:vesicle transport through interaction with t-SNAREs homolog 1B [Drosophila serrata]
MSNAGYHQLPSGGDYDSRQAQLSASMNDVLQRTTESIQRSNQIAIETENMGVEVLGELGEQRESLLRTTRRLEDADQDLSKSRAIIRKLSREVLYNKIILILIIILEVGILIGLLVLKFAHL